jgi:HEAT repeat protein
MQQGKPRSTAALAHLSRSALVGSLLTVGALVVAAPDAEAQPAKGKASPPPAGKLDPKRARVSAPRRAQAEAIARTLAGGEPSKQAAALAEVTTLTEAELVSMLAPAVERLLRAGSTAEVSKAAIEALGALGSPSSAPVLADYLRHRAPELRRASARALTRLRGPEAVAAMRDGLRSVDGQVRGFAATGLGAAGATEALGELFTALDRGVPEAAASIGQLCAADDCKKLVARLGAIGFDVMTSGLDPMLFRATSLPEDQQVEIVVKVRSLGTKEAQSYLADVQKRWPKTGSKRVLIELELAASAIMGGAK